MNWRFLHVGVITKDALRTAEFLSQLGFDVARGPFHKPPRPEDPRSSIVMDMQKGGVTLELVQPVAGPSVNMEFLRAVGEGVNHICFEVDDLEAEAARMEVMGFPVILASSYVRYFDTRRHGNLIIELRLPIDRSPPMIPL